MENKDVKYGGATKLSQIFIDSKLTPLLIVATVLLGLLALSMTPREEEPQIIVPMIDVMVMHPGAGPEEVETLISRPWSRSSGRSRISNTSTRAASTASR